MGNRNDNDQAYLKESIPSKDNGGLSGGSPQKHLPKTEKEAGCNDLVYQKNWCKTILRFMTGKFGESKGLGIFMEIVDQQKTGAHFKSLVTDLLEWMKVLSAADFAELDLLLIRGFGQGLYSQLKDLKNEISVIRSRGYIINEDEYRLVLSYLDQYVPNSTYSDAEPDIAVLNALLSTYV